MYQEGKKRKQRYSSANWQNCTGKVAMRWMWGPGFLDHAEVLSWKPESWKGNAFLSTLLRWPIALIPFRLVWNHVSWHVLHWVLNLSHLSKCSLGSFLSPWRKTPRLTLSSLCDVRCSPGGNFVIERCNLLSVFPLTLQHIESPSASVGDFLHFPEFL